MGIALWIVCGVAACFLGRIVPLRHRVPLGPDLIVASAASLAAGAAATAADFGGWNAADWRAGLFVLFVTLAAIGMLRLAQAVRNRPA